MTLWEGLLLVVGGFAAGVINTMAGGGSALTVPLLVLAGVPGNAANASNRVGVLTSNLAAVASFRRLGTLDAGVRRYLPVLAPVVVGSLVGSIAISRLSDEGFETVFGLLMMPIVILSILKPKVRTDGQSWPMWVTLAVFSVIGIYGGAVQAGVGLVLLAALTRAGFDLVTANAVKVLINVVVTVIALPVFILAGDVRWAPALLLAVGFTAGGWSGAHLAVRGGERWIRALVTVAALALAASLLDLY
jgi:uncharacterized protein